MFSPLALRLPIMPDEPPVYFLSRLAARNFMKARPFAMDMGFTFNGVERGDQTAIDTLAAVSGVSVADLNACGSRTVGDRIMLKGQLLDLNSVRRARVQACPECLRHDVASSDLPSSVAMYGRVQWMLNSVETCEKHGIALVTIADKLPECECQDWSPAAASGLDDISALVKTAVARRPSRLEGYLLDRLNEKPAESWLDGLPFYAAEQTARLFGTMALFRDSTTPFSLYDSNKYSAGEIGFDIVNGGPSDILSFLTDLKRDQLQSRHAAGKKTAGPAPIYGRLYSRLTLMDDPAYNPVRDILTEHIMSHFPMGPGDDIFGTPVTSRRFHSILTLQKKYDKGDRTVIKILTDEGLLKEHAGNLRDMLFDAPTTERLMDHMVKSVSLAEAQKRINVTANVMNTLRKDKIISRQCTESDATRDRYSIVELDDFVRRLFVDAQPVDSDSANAVCLMDASARNRCTISVIVKFILDRKLPWVGSRNDVRGVASIRVNPGDVSQLLARQVPIGVHAFEAGTYLKIAPPVIRRIADRGLIKGTCYVDPLSGRKKMVLSTDDIERFNAEYVTLFNLARAMRRQLSQLRAELTAQGILPAKETIGVGATFYRRSDVPFGN
ncbi:TniQ family protein [Tardiphaga sp. 285_C5_N1_2]|uniref:TniQ family protein n=1 Tax=Tardiphaga sp. 285_C5_N1_2 TaxID=3240775 RepID=UPI003F8B8A07